jgi:hypothetical protein
LSLYFTPRLEYGFKFRRGGASYAWVSQYEMKAKDLAVRINSER